MDTIVERFEKIKSNITALKPNKLVNIIAVSKTFSLDHIRPLIDYGHIDFGENKVQEAKTKWSDEKKHKHNLRLHMIGKLQTNKAKDAVKLFDYIHSVDSKRLADSLAKHQLSLNKSLKYFISNIAIIFRRIFKNKYKFILINCYFFIVTFNITLPARIICAQNSSNKSEIVSI